MKKKLKYYFQKALKEKWALGHFNFSNLEILRAIITAAKRLKAPVIVGTSEGESKFFGLEQAVALTKIYREATGLPIFLNLDHGKSFEYIKRAIEAGYDAVQFDGSSLSLKENIRLTKEVVGYARKFGVLVEGEVGALGTESSKIYEKPFKIEEKNLTDPDQAEKFLKETKVDSLAVNIGTFHGVQASGGNPRIRLQRLKEIKNKAGDTPWVLHGGSGTSEKDIKAAIKLGVVKININTELRKAYTNSLRKVLKKRPKEVVPYKYLPEVEKAVQKVVEDKIQLFGSRNRS